MEDVKFFLLLTVFRSSLRRCLLVFPLLSFFDGCGSEDTDAGRLFCISFTVKMNALNSAEQRTHKNITKELAFKIGLGGNRENTLTP